MKNKKVIITMVVTIAVLLILGIVISIINISKANIVKVGKIKFATKNSILESLVGFKKQRVSELIRNKGFNEMRLIGD